MIVCLAHTLHSYCCLATQPHHPSSLQPAVIPPRISFWRDFRKDTFIDLQSKKWDSGQNQSLWNIAGARTLQAPHNSGRDNAAGIIIVRWTSPPLILQIHSLHQIATVTPSHVPPRRHGIIIVIFHYFGTNCMVLFRLRLSTKVRLLSQFLIWFIRESPIFLAASSSNQTIGDWKKLKILVQNQSFWNIVGARPTASTSQQRER